jgi:hypothetical protein
LFDSTPLVRLVRRAEDDVDDVDVDDEDGDENRQFLLEELIL